METGRELIKEEPKEATTEPKKVDDAKPTADTKAPAKPAADSLGGFIPTFKKVYSLQSGCEKFLVMFGCFCSFCNGAILPTYALILGLSIQAFDPSLEEDERSAALNMVIKVATASCLA